jgi:hypothetical protein
MALYSGTYNRGGLISKPSLGVPAHIVGGYILSPFDKTVDRRVNKAVVSQVHTLVIDTATSGGVYTVRINGLDLSYTADGSATKTEIRDGLQALIAGSFSGVSGTFASVADLSTDGLTLTSKPGDDVSIEVLAGLMTATETVEPSNGTDFYPGTLYCRDIATGDTSHPALTAAVAQVTDIAFSTAVNSVKHFVQVFWNGGTYTGEYTSDGSATLAEIHGGLATALNAALPASSVLAAGDGTDLTLTAEVAGVGFSASAWSLGAATVTITTSTANSAASLSKPIEGIVTYQDSMIGDHFPPLIDFQGFTRGQISLKTEDRPASNGDPLYVRVTQGSRADYRPGNLRFDSDSGKAVLLSSVSDLSIELDFEAGPNVNNVWIARVK